MARVGSCYTHPTDEHAIWQSEVRRKGASGGGRTRIACPPTCAMEAAYKVWGNAERIMIEAVQRSGWR